MASPACAPVSSTVTLRSFQIAHSCGRLITQVSSTVNEKNHHYPFLPQAHTLFLDVPSYKLAIFIINFSWMTHASGTEHQHKSGRVRCLWSSALLHSDLSQPLGNEGGSWGREQWRLHSSLLRSRRTPSSSSQSKLGWMGKLSKELGLFFLPMLEARNAGERMLCVRPSTSAMQNG